MCQSTHNRLKRVKWDQEGEASEKGSAIATKDVTVLAFPQ